VSLRRSRLSARASRNHFVGSIVPSVTLCEQSAFSSRDLPRRRVEMRGTWLAAVYCWRVRAHAMEERQGKEQRVSIADSLHRWDVSVVFRDWSHLIPRGFKAAAAEGRKALGRPVRRGANRAEGSALRLDDETVADFERVTGALQRVFGASPLRTLDAYIMGSSHQRRRTRWAQRAGERAAARFSMRLQTWQRGGAMDRIVSCGALLAPPRPGARPRVDAAKRRRSSPRPRCRRLRNTSPTS